MRFYNQDTELHFGKYEGKTLAEVYQLDPQYIEWCAINLDHFYLSNEVIKDLSSIQPIFQFSEEATEKLEQKYQDWEVEQDEEEEDDYDYDPMDNYGRSYEKYGGYNDWSDDVIDDAFEGDPGATWNVD